jgi:hypothetical protein
MQELSVTINNSVLPSVRSHEEESEISVADLNAPRPDAYDPLSVFGGIPAELHQEPSSVSVFGRALRVCGDWEMHVNQEQMV